MTVIDVHTHAYTREWYEIMRTHGGDYNIQMRPDGKEEIFKKDTPVAFPQPGHFDYDLRIKQMDATGIDISIVSLTCPNVYWGGEEISCKAAVASNDSMIEAQNKYPDRIRWYTSLPWEYPEKAVQELERTVALGACGVMVLANIAGRSLTDPFFAPIWQAIDDKALPVLVHPTDPPGALDMDMGSYDLSWSVGFMFDTTLAFTRMIFDGFFDKYPNMKLIASHGGGALPYLVGRFEKGDEVELAERRVMKKSPTEYLQHIYFDCINYDARAMQYLMSIVGPERVMFGTDWPHQVFDTKGAMEHTADLPDDQCKAIRSATAMKVFNI